MIGVLAGGDSSEREVSLISGQRVDSALRDLGERCELIEIDNLDDLVQGLRGIDTAFICLHGGAGEDGTVQMLLDVMGIPYCGSRALASALAMDKARAKTTLRSKRIPVPEACVYQPGEPMEEFCREVIEKLSFPVVLKPCRQGSSIGVTILSEESELMAAATEVLSRFGSLLIEEYIPGHELTVGVLRHNGKDEVLPVVEIRAQDRFFDYEAKYTEGRTQFVIPAKLDEGLTSRVQETSLAAHHAIGCYGFSRVDLRLSKDGIPFVLEVNTVPGMTPTSDLPQAAAARGITFSELVRIMLETASQEVTE